MRTNIGIGGELMRRVHGNIFSYIGLGYPSLSTGGSLSGPPKEASRRRVDLLCPVGGPQLCRLVFV
jgi:hypothetical protein